MHFLSWGVEPTHQTHETHGHRWIRPLRGVYRWGVVKRARLVGDAARWHQTYPDIEPEAEVDMGGAASFNEGGQDRRRRSRAARADWPKLKIVTNARGHGRAVPEDGNG